MRPADIERFWRNVQKSPGEGCWLWIGPHNTDGRGRFFVDGKTVYAYRFAWELANGPIPAGLLACHSCDVPACVRPDHLFIGTAGDNSRDAAAKGRLPGPGIFGEQHHAVTVPDARVAEARVMHAAGLLQREIAEHLDVHQTTISSWVTGRTRKSQEGASA